MLAKMAIRISPIRDRLQFMLPALAFGHKTPYTTQRRNEPASMGNKTDITLYTASTPNGIKVPILLEELGLEYKVRRDFMPYTGYK